MDHQISNELPPVQNPNQQGPPLQSAETGNYTGYTEQQSGQAIEAGRTSTPVAEPVTQQGPPPAQAPTHQVPQNNVGFPVPNTPAIADDADLIEKEWVDKAKEIVARTRHDPYMQNKEVELMKADYMRKRYNKEVKITED
mgnify:CR=1 FL=1